MAERKRVEVSFVVRLKAVEVGNRLTLLLRLGEKMDNEVRSGGDGQSGSEEEEGEERSAREKGNPC